MREDRIKYNYIRHTQEALDDIFNGLKNLDSVSLEIGVSDLVVFGLPLGDNDNHQLECIMVDYEVPPLPNHSHVVAWKKAKVVQAYLDHQMYDKYGDLWHDMVEELMMSIYKLLSN